MPRYIITGGPGAGKTSLLEALHRQHFACSPEASRHLIHEESAKGSNCLPWIDLNCFAERALERMVADWQAVTNDGICFFDRGIPDIIAYLTIAGLPVAEKYRAALREYRYAETVLLLPPWEQIYTRDEARWQSFEEAETIYHQLKTIYLSSGYSLEEIPKCSIEERMELVLQTLALL